MYKLVCDPETEFACIIGEYDSVNSALDALESCDFPAAIQVFGTSILTNTVEAV